MVLDERHGVGFEIRAPGLPAVGGGGIGTGGRVGVGVGPRVRRVIVISIGLGLTPLALILGVRSMAGDQTDDQTGDTSRTHAADVDIAAQPPLPPERPTEVAPSRTAAAAPMHEGQVEDQRRQTTERIRVRTDSGSNVPADVLQQELELMGRARAALRDADPERALLLLDEHARRFPAATLEQERERSRLTALCQVGRTTDAQTLAAKLGLPACAASVDAEE
jgi:hypothetical protein